MPAGSVLSPSIPSGFSAQPARLGRSVFHNQPQNVHCPSGLLRLLPLLLRLPTEQRMQQATTEGMTLSATEQEGLNIILQASLTREQQLHWWMRLLNQTAGPSCVYRLDQRDTRFRIQTPPLKEAGTELNHLLRLYMGRKLGCRFLLGLQQLGWITPSVLNQALLQRTHWMITDYQLPSPIPMASIKPGLAQQQLRLSMEAFIEQQCEHNRDLVTQIRCWLRTTPKTRRLDTAAADFQLSSRSLNRYLASLGSSFQEELDQFHCQQALQCLSGDETNMQTISLSLGYENPANFGRACKRWFGQTPAAVQYELQRLHSGA
jgi:AraC-like DNA-binding protein